MPDEQAQLEQHPEENEIENKEYPEGAESLLAECRKEKNDYLLGWQRCKADAMNIKQQQETRSQHIIQFATEDLIQSLIPVLDTFDHALQGKDASDPYVQGFGRVQTQLLSILSHQGLTVISDTGASFDVSRHEAVESVPVTQEKDNNKVIETVEHGYMLQAKVIKPAKVKIGEYQNHGT
ncbi:MAG: nucleotide exchange factor GrpE [Candidatus Ryanbacteria bacterium RIFCSPHIGHO2_01_FULL_45_22]|uniref:Protein GrpE n=2 Tax=Candidatus Ryaniibacteriota TaxID=1817914 RepID=A0A1G2G121_9BACT|nr:MAG: nucleotide exchange factor GrpE [Candidatus Ryanbacteria bacterium RIFCSPHIGHO2_01_FULL_45_22]OGZ46345.1 MAG: nucleotide exchange factor GrpE [Candidatus Ryanbacteria bacterium RIFCSPHIGHO2_02_FULL_45_13b]